MRRFGSLPSVLAQIVVGLALLAASCAGPPQRGLGRLDRDSDAMETADPVLMTGVVVDTIGASGTLSVKDVEDHTTWTIMTGPETRFYGAEGGMINLTEIQIGERIQIRGRSRVPLIVEADEIDIQKEPPPAAGAQEPLPR